MTCPATTMEFGEIVRCRLPAGHDGHHEGACIGWSTPVPGPYSDSAAPGDPRGAPRKPRNKTRRPGTQLKAYYSLAEYAALIGENVHTVRSQAKAGTIRVGLHGKKRVIYLSYLAAEKPELWASMVLLAQMNNTSRK